MGIRHLLVFLAVALVVVILVSSCAFVSVGSLEYAKNRADEATFLNSVFKNYAVDVPADSIAQDSLRMMLRIIEIMEGKDDTVYFSKLRRMNPFTEPQVVDSLLRVWICRLDLLSGPQTPQNEKWEELKRRIVFCNERYYPRESHFEFWDDIRSLLAIKLGPQFSSYVVTNICWDPYQGYLTPENTRGRSKKTPTCFIDNMEFDTPEGAQRFGCEGDMSDMRAHNIVPYSGDVSSIGSATDVAAIAQKQMMNQKEKIIESPGILVNLFPDVEEELDIPASVTILPQDTGYLCLLAGGVGQEKVEADSNNLASISFKRRALRDLSIPEDLHLDFDSSTVLYKAKHIKGYCYPFSFVYPLPDSGKYLLIASASNARGLGVITASVHVPSVMQSSDKISGLMLLDSPMKPIFESNGSTRFSYRGWSFHGKPQATYDRGDSVYLFVEVKKPDSAENKIGYDIEAEVYLKPVSNREGEAIFGPVKVLEVLNVVRDSLGRPLKSRLPGSHSSGKLPEQNSRTGKSSELVASKSYHTNEFFPTQELIALSFKIPKDFKRHTYANCRIEVHINGKPAEWTYRTIRIL
ncbi:MAG: hypothetical protein WCX12_03780 [Candidatus Paceibacterota bacterium]|jgi:hypothetical protein